MEDNRIIRILHTAPLVYGGITSFVINVASFIDKEKFVIDNLCFRDQKEFSEEIFCSYGGKKYVNDISGIKFKPAKMLKKFTGTYKIIKDNNIDIFHMDTDSTDQIFLAAAAKMAGVKKVIYHSHNTESGRIGKFRRFIEHICKPFMSIFVDEYIACSKTAAEFLFPKHIVNNNKYELIKNGINLEKYAYNEKIRADYRVKYNTENKFVIGHIGRFTEQKNHTFLIDIFDEIHKKRSDAILFMIGIGELQEDVRQKVLSKGLQDCAIFLNGSNDIPNLLQMIDVFVMPSLYEGLPVAGIEAQAAGIPFVFSDTITSELAVSKMAEVIPLESTAEEWADCILKMGSNPHDTSQETIKQAGYDIKDTVVRLQEIYSVI